MITERPSRRTFLNEMAGISLSGIALAAGLTVGGSARQMLGQQNIAGTRNSRLAKGARAVVATVHPLASQAAIAAFERGGNAIDAAVAASLMLSVVDGHNSGLGGGCLALVRTANGQLLAWDGREKAPGRATPQMFYRQGQPDPQLSQLGPLAAGVPGLLAALERLSTLHGRIDWSSSLLGAAEVAEAGFELSDSYARVLKSAADRLALFPASADVLLNLSGKPWQAGERLRQVDLARTLRRVEEQGVEWFYQGEFAERTARFMRETGGLLDVQDFLQYTAVQRTPISTRYRGRSIVGFPPPSSGGVHAAQMLGMLSPFDLAAIFSESQVTGIHLLLEVMKRAMADRAYWLGDADFAKVPRSLLDEDYLRERSSTIDLSRAVAVESHGQPPRAEVDLFGQQRHTTHLTTADEEGNVVAITQTVNTSFGCKMIVPGTGVILNNEMDDFSIAPGVRNAFGLLGSDANLIAPGKRPLSSMSPTIVLDEQGAPILSCGAAGGPKIITAVLQVLVRVLDLGESIEQAVAAPRVHHQWSPDVAVCEQALDEQVVRGLQSLGHTVSRISSSAIAQGLSLVSGELTAAADPRAQSRALAL